MASIKILETTTYSQEVKAALSKCGQVSRKQLLWLDLYFSTAQMNAIQAAMLAKYKFPSVEGPRLAKRFSEPIALIFNEQSALRRAEANEVMELISQIAREGQSESNRLKALELLAKIHGLTSERLSITLDRRGLMKQIEEMLDAKRKQIPPALLAKPIEVETVSRETMIPREAREVSRTLPSGKGEE